MDAPRPETTQAHIRLWDAISLIVGIIIGVGIFETPAGIFDKAPGPWSALLVWLVAGLVALVGALCFAELASTYPRSGGEYVYLTRAFGSLTGYMFAWAQLAVIRPGSIATLAYVFALYAGSPWHLGPWPTLFLAAGAIIVLTIINVVGVTLGKHTQNFLTVLKVLGLAAIIVVGLFLAPAGGGWMGQMMPGLVESMHVVAGNPPPPPDLSSGWFATAMILALWTYAGWHEAAYIAAEIKDGPRAIPRALILGTILVTIIYLLVNLAFWMALGQDGARSKAAAADVIGAVFPNVGRSAMTILVVISALGAINGMVFTTARIFSEFGTDHRLFTPLSHWSKRMGTPVRALVVQGVLSLGFLLGVGIVGQSRDTFETAILVTAAVFWMFFLLTGISLFVLRAKDPDRTRPFRVPGYPWLPLVFCAASAYMAYGAVEYEPKLSFWGLLVLLAGLPFYYFPKKKLRGKPEVIPAAELEGHKVGGGV